MSRKIELSKVIAHITEELKKAKKASPKNAVMQFEECEVEFAIEVEKSGETGINVWVLELGGGLSRTEKNTVKIKFKRVSGNTLRFIDMPRGEGPVIVEQGQKKVKM